MQTRAPSRLLLVACLAGLVLPGCRDENGEPPIEIANRLTSVDAYRVRFQPSQGITSTQRNAEADAWRSQVRTIASQVAADRLRRQRLRGPGAVAADPRGQQLPRPGVRVFERQRAVPVRDSGTGRRDPVRGRRGGVPDRHVVDRRQCLRPGCEGSAELQHSRPRASRRGYRPRVSSGSRSSWSPGIHRSPGQSSISGPCPSRTIRRMERARPSSRSWWWRRRTAGRTTSRRCSW